MRYRRLLPKLFLCGAGFTASSFGEATPASSDHDFSLAVTAPDTLTQLESLGLRLDNQLSGSGSGTDCRHLRQVPMFSTLAATIEQDLQLAQEHAAKVAGNFRGRLSYFDKRWLNSAHTRFDLVGVIMRPDRVLQKPTSCGEIRAVYRLVLDSVGNLPPTKARASSKLPATDALESAASSLPMTISLQYELARPKTGCGKVFEQTRLPQDTPTSKLGAEFFPPGSPVLAMLGRSLPPSALEINLQLSRWSTDGSTSFTDQVHYLLRNFAVNPSQQTLTVAPLENTPDVPRLKHDAALKLELLQWLTAADQLAAIDRGAALVPSKFLATKTIAVVPYGAKRRTNHPFSALFSGADFASVDFALLPVSRSPERFLSRLDGLSCQGCHAARSASGFHFLGREHFTAPFFNRLISPHSAYYEQVQEFRQALASKRLDLSAAIFPDPLHASSFAGLGASCGLGNVGFSTWGCQAGLRCRDDQVGGDYQIGACYPNDLSSDGSPCDQATIEGNDDPLLDSWHKLGARSCRGVCATSANGFPEGLCSNTCQVQANSPGCVNVPNLGPFTMCLQTGRAFGDCLARNHTPATMPVCRVNNDCRPDYVCVATPNGVTGICAPPYFVPQLTIEDHQTGGL